MNMPHLCKAKIKSKENYLDGKWVEGYPLCSNSFDNKIDRIIWVDSQKEKTTQYYNSIYPETLCWFTGYEDSFHNKIYQNDIIKFYIGNHLVHEILVWWDQECMCMFAVEINKDFTYNGLDFFNTDNRLNNYSTFCLQLKNLYGDYTKIERIGNLFDSPEIMSFYKNLAMENGSQFLKENIKNEEGKFFIKNFREKFF